MKFNKLNRNVHYWTSVVVALPLLIVLSSGLLLQLKKHWAWVQPPEREGSARVPVVSFEQVLATVKSVPELGVGDWSDVRRLDVRPSRGLIKVWLRNGFEAQIDLGTGELLQVAYRRSDVIEAIHDGSFFAGNWTKFGLFLPAAVGLLVLSFGGLWMFWSPFSTQLRRRKVTKQRSAKADVTEASQPPSDSVTKTSFGQS